MAFTKTYSGANGWTWGISDFAAAQTDTELVAAPAAGKHIEVTAWKFSSDTAGQMQLQSGNTNLVDKSYVAANATSGVALSDGDRQRSVVSSVVRLDAATALVFTSDITGNHSVAALYRVVSR